MTDSLLSSDLEFEAPPPVPQKKHRNKRAAPQRDARPATSAQDRVELRCHNVLEKVFNKAKQANDSTGHHGTSHGTRLSPSHGDRQHSSSEPPRDDARSEVLSPHADYNLARSKAVSQSLPDVSLVPQSTRVHRSRRAPEATFIPTAVGLRSEGQSASVDLNSVLSAALAKVILAGM